MKNRTFSVLVENHFGVLARVSSLFAGRGYNIDSLTVGETEDPSVSRMTIAVSGDDRVLEQISKQLNKLVDVIKVIDLSEEGAFIDRELLLIRADTGKQNRAEVIEIAILPMATPSAMIRLLVSVIRTGVLPTRP